MRTVSVLICCLYLVPILGCADVKKRPNILFLFSDDQQHDTIHALGNKAIATPNLDTLVGSGVTFRNAYIMGGSSPAVCSPSRACLLTGRTLWNIENQGLWGFEMSEKFKTMPEVFRENGYVTFATGKNEPGRMGQFHRAYSEGDRLLFSGTNKSKFRQFLYPFSPEGNYDKKKVKRVQYRGTHSTQMYADACIRFLKKHAASEKPFYAYVSFQAPHDPRQSPDAFRKRYRDEDMKLPASFMAKHPFKNGGLRKWDETRVRWPRTPADIRRHIADYYALITCMDAQIGRILAALKDTGKYDNTIIVFASDNGLALGRHGLVGKQNVYEHSVRVPLILSGPGIEKEQTRNQLCYLYDIYPTLCDLVGLKTPKTVQYKSLKPVLTDAGAVHRTHMYFAYMNWQRAIRDERYKLIEYCVEDERHTQLFDLQKDPDELKNLADAPEHKGTLQKLRQLLKKERVRLNDGHTRHAFTNDQGKYFWSRYEARGKSGKNQ